MKRGPALLLFLILFCAVGYLFWETRPAIRKARDEVAVTKQMIGDSVIVIERTVVQESPRAPKVPDIMVFAGDTIRFDRVDMRERMDRELIAFTYSHTNSLLMLKRSTRIFHPYRSPR